MTRRRPLRCSRSTIPWTGLTSICHGGRWQREASHPNDRFGRLSRRLGRCLSDPTERRLLLLGYDASAAPYRSGLLSLEWHGKRTEELGRRSDPQTSPLRHDLCEVPRIVCQEPIRLGVKG